MSLLISPFTSPALTSGVQSTRSLRFTRVLQNIPHPRGVDDDKVIRITNSSARTMSLLERVTPSATAAVVRAEKRDSRTLTLRAVFQSLPGWVSGREPLRKGYPLWCRVAFTCRETTRENTAARVSSPPYRRFRRGRHTVRGTEAPGLRLS